MKKLAIIIVLALFGYSVNAQGFRLGANVGIPVGDASDFSSFFANADVDYDWSISEDFNAGLTTGFSLYSGKDSFGDFKYLPAGGSIDYKISEEASIGGDVGVAISLETGGGTDLLYRFQFRYEVSNDVDVSARFNSISSNGSAWSSLTIGIGYNFGGSSGDE